MALFKTRPTIQLRIPRELSAGQQVPAEVILECEREVPIDKLEVRITGQEQWLGQEHFTRTFLSLRAPLSGPQTLSAGRHRLPFRFDLPEHAPPSYRGAAARIGYRVEAHADIPWWPDRRASFEAFVVRPPLDNPPATPRLYSSNRQGPLADEPHVELSLANDWTRTGDIVSGAFALTNTAFNRYRKATVKLKCTEHCHSGSKATYSPKSYVFNVDDLDRGEATMIPFRFLLAADAPAGFEAAEGGLCSVSWSLELHVDNARGRNLTMTVPFLVLPKASDERAAVPRLAPPVVGSDRLQTAWKEAGAAHGFVYEGQELSGRFGACSVVIRRENTGGDGVFVVAEIRYPSLHLGLEVERASSLRRTLGGGILVGHDDWDRDYFVLARDAAQTASAMGRLVKPRKLPEQEHDLGEDAFRKPLVLHSMDDELCRLRSRDNGTRLESLKQIAEASAHAASALDRLTNSVPPPTGTEGSVPEWIRLAQVLGGRLEIGHLRIEATAGNTVVVQQEFDKKGAPSSIMVRLVPTGDVEVEPLSILAGDTSEVDAAAKGELRELLVAAARSDELSIRPDEFTLRIADPALHADSVETRVAHLNRVVGLLRGESGPYR